MYICITKIKILNYITLEPTSFLNLWKCAHFKKYLHFSMGRDNITEKAVKYCGRTMNLYWSIGEYDEWILGGSGAISMFHDCTTILLLLNGHSVLAITNTFLHCEKRKLAPSFRLHWMKRQEIGTTKHNDRTER